MVKDAKIYFRKIFNKSSSECIKTLEGYPHRVTSVYLSLLHIYIHTLSLSFS